MALPGSTQGKGHKPSTRKLSDPAILGNLALRNDIPVFEIQPQRVYTAQPCPPPPLILRSPIPASGADVHYVRMMPLTSNVPTTNKSAPRLLWNVR